MEHEKIDFSGKKPQCGKCGGELKFLTTLADGGTANKCMSCKAIRNVYYFTRRLWPWQLEFWVYLYSLIWKKP